MTPDNGNLTEKFSAAAETRVLQGDIGAFYFNNMSGYGIQYRQVFNPEDGKRLLKLCGRIVENQARQDKIIAEQAEHIAALEAQFAPRRPLLGKPPLEPKGP